MDRRAFLHATCCVATGAIAGGIAVASPGARLILLGTAGGPRPRLRRSASSQVILIGADAYVIDCGDGVAHQLVAAGIPLNAIRHVFITHHHSDHNADYGNLLLLAWTAGLKTPVDTWGPPPLSRMTKLFFEANAMDIDARVADEKRIPLQPLVTAHELSQPGVVLRNDAVIVTAALVNHPPMTHAFAYRFDTPARSIVISGDTTYSKNVVNLARGADVLVHEAMYPTAVERLVANVSNAGDLKRSILSHHTSAADAGRVANEAQVKCLVLSHLVPAEDAEVTERMWIEAAGAQFRGPIIVGRDLLEI